MKAFVLCSYGTPDVLDLMNTAGRLTWVDRPARPHEPWTRGNG
jgi:hypothetical protein